MGAREQGAPRGHAGVGSVKAGLKRKPTLGAQGPVVGKPRSELEAFRWSSPTALPDGSAPTHPARAPRFHARFAMSPASERAVPAKAPAAPANSMKSRRLAARTGARVLSIDKDVDIGRALAEVGGAVMGSARPAASALKRLAKPLFRAKARLHRANARDLCAAFQSRLWPTRSASPRCLTLFSRAPPRTYKPRFGGIPNGTSTV